MIDLFLAFRNHDGHEECLPAADKLGRLNVLVQRQRRAYKTQKKKSEKGVKKEAIQEVRKEEGRQKRK